MIGFDLDRRSFGGPFRRQKFICASDHVGAGDAGDPVVRAVLQTKITGGVAVLVGGQSAIVADRNVFPERTRRN